MSAEKKEELSSHLTTFEELFYNKNEFELWNHFEKNYPDGVKYTISEIIAFLTKDIDRANEHICFKKELNVLALAVNEVGNLGIYRNEDGKLIKRKEEKHPTDQRFKRTQFEHLLLTAFYALRNFDTDINDKDTVEDLQLVKNTIPRLNIVLLLASVFHDTKEDWNSSPESAEEEIKKLLKTYGFSEFEKFVIPIVRILTNEEDDEKSDKERFSTYLEKLENPPEEVFAGYELNDNEKKSIEILARHIKLRGDFIHNLTSPQTEKAKKLKEPEYLAMLDYYYPNWREHLSPKQRERIEEHNSNVLDEVVKEHQHKVEKELNK